MNECKLFIVCYLSNSMNLLKDLNKPEFKPRFLSEYSMGELDFRRFDDWLKWIEKYSGEINSSHIPDLLPCQHYFAGLNVLYKQWRPIMAIPAVQKELDQAIETAKGLKRTWERNKKNNVPFSEVKILEFVDVLDKIHTKLMEIKQVIGLGIVVKRNLSTKEKIKRGVRGDRDFSNLPEA